MFISFPENGENLALRWFYREKKRQRDEAKRRAKLERQQLQKGAQLTRPPVIQQKQAIPPFELPNHQSGLTGPIFKHEELLSNKHSSETELFNQAYRATQKVIFVWTLSIRCNQMKITSLWCHNYVILSLDLHVCQY